MDLFADTLRATAAPGSAPLATRVRPTVIDEIVGQEHVLGPGKILRRAIEADRLSSIILYGPPGCGKTTLAEVIARATNKTFERTSGVVANVPTLRALLQGADERRRINGNETILFIDEIHRFNKAQQDVLLPQVEDGTITLVGATTHNPFFFVNSPLTSRSLVVELESLSEEAVVVLLQRALQHENGLARDKAEVDADAFTHLAAVCEGDARRALNALEIAVLTTPPDEAGRLHITRAIAADSIQKKPIVYDHDEDGHYDTVSAFIKSVRGSDPHAALYWLAKMLEAGEDPRFVARRLVILASEDIGNADPRGLTVAVSAMHAVEFIGMPEARITLAQATTYLATAPKSNASYAGLNKATDDIKSGRVLPVPKPLRGTGYAGAEELGHSGYVYPHDYAGNFVEQEYIPTSATYYEPCQQGYEETIARRMEHWRAERAKARNEETTDE